MAEETGAHPPRQPREPDVTAAVPTALFLGGVTPARRRDKGRAGAIVARQQGARPARYGEAGAEIIDKSPGLSLVLTDVNMPRMDGISLVRELRALDHYKFVPMLVLTTESGSDTKQRGKEAGATGWIVKPFNPEQLLATIARVL